MNIHIINLLTLITCDCFSTNHQNVTIFHRTESDEINGHAKPSESERQSSSTWRIISKKSEPRSNKYFVTWRPDLGEEENREILSIISSKYQQKQQEYQPQFYFSHKKQTQTSQPIFNESLTSLKAPPETSTVLPPPTSPAWSYSPVFNTIFSATPKYKPTFLPSKQTTTPALRLKSTTTVTTTTTITTITTITTSSTTTAGTTTSSRRRTTSTSTIVQAVEDDELPFQSNLPLEDDETILQSPTTFIAYVRYIIVTALRFLVNTLNGQVDQHSGTIMESQTSSPSASSFVFSSKEMATIVGFPLVTGLMLLGGAPVSAVLVTAWLAPLLALLSLQ